MLSRVHIRNFKRLDDVEIELGDVVVLIGPNNSGKTVALQALCLWEVGLRRWVEKRGSGKVPTKRPGVAINRRDLVSVPIGSAKLLWRDLRVNETRREDGRQRTNPVLIEVTVEGTDGGRTWSVGFEFYYANPESFYCRPTEETDASDIEAAEKTRVAMLPPMSGIAAEETKLEPGAVDVLIGEGQTAQVLRNLCFRLLLESADGERWDRLVEDMRRLFGVEILSPTFVEARGEIRMAYRERGVELDLSSAGRGLQQTLLLLASLYGNPRTVLLLDEPDAHLEILRQRQTYNLIAETARQQGAQVIAASHSEVILREAAERDVVVAFVGRPHRIDDRGSQVRKALADFGLEHYYQSELKGWVLYLEGATDLAILQALADKLGHKAADYLSAPFVHYVSNDVQAALKHFWGMREAMPSLAGVALFDRLGRDLPSDMPPIRGLQWRKREIENYICSEAVLMRFAAADGDDTLLDPQADRQKAMRDAVARVSDALALEGGEPDPFGDDVKASDMVLDRLFRAYYQARRLPNRMAKTSYYGLVGFVHREEIAEEVSEKLDAILEVAEAAETSRRQP